MKTNVLVQDFFLFHYCSEQVAEMAVLSIRALQVRVTNVIGVDELFLFFFVMCFLFDGPPGWFLFVR